MSDNQIDARKRRKKRVRAKIVGRSNFLRLSIFRSNKYIYAQVIDDKKGITLASANDLENKTKEKLNKTQRASQVGERLGQKLLKLNISRVVFDRGCYMYEGRVKALANGVRKAGIII